MKKQQEFNKIVDKNSDKIYGLFMKMTGSHDIADELTQKTFIKVYDNLSTFRGDSELSTWIYRIAVNVGKNHLRKEKAKKLIGLDKIKSLSEENNVQLNSDIKNKIHEAVQKLSPKQNMVMLLRGFQDLPYKQIGAIMGISENSAKVNYSHALKNLKKYLNRMGVTYEDL
ncbi:MAG TPA: RNA polymerase sigma factor [bacterium]|nr:RNA polymerase sigma factor [bacterium]